MTTPYSSCGHGDLLRSLTVELSTTKRERDSWQVVALASMAYASNLAREIDILDVRGRQIRQRSQDEREVWTDQTDLRREAMAEVPVLVGA